MKLGLYGGTFDPIHRGHVEPVLAAVAQLGLDRVIYLPTGDPPHKQGRQFAPALARYAMAELALLDHPRLRVSTLELSDETPSYTVDSIRSFRAQDPEAEIFLLLGADAFLELEIYRGWQDIVEAAVLAVLGRSRSSLSSARDSVQSRLLADGRAVVIEHPPVEVSSTELRRYLARGKRPPAGWAASRVVDFCLKYQLYS